MKACKATILTRSDLFCLVYLKHIIILSIWLHLTLLISWFRRQYVNMIFGNYTSLLSINMPDCKYYDVWHSDYNYVQMYAPFIFMMILLCLYSYPIPRRHIVFSPSFYAIEKMLPLAKCIALSIGQQPSWLHPHLCF